MTIRGVATGASEERERGRQKEGISRATSPSLNGCSRNRMDGGLAVFKEREGIRRVKSEECLVAM